MTATQVIVGDCRTVMASMEADSIDSVVCDPPYGLNFMGKEWDRPKMLGQVNIDPARERGPGGLHVGKGSNSRGYKDNDPILFQRWTEEWAREAYRVLRPGGHLVAFGGTRTSHRMVCAIEDAGFEIRDGLVWITGQGFPKNLDFAADPAESRNQGRRIVKPEFVGHPQEEGFGTALKPSMEPICLARKPLIGTVAQNVLTHGTGALNIDACRIDYRSDADEQESKSKNRHADYGTQSGGNQVYGDYSMVPRQNYDAAGRWPANVILDPAAAAALDATVGERPGGAARLARRSGIGYMEGGQGTESEGRVNYPAGGGPARFYFTAPIDDPDAEPDRWKYCAKASRRERNAGLDGMPEGDRPLGISNWPGQTNGSGETMGPSAPQANHHPTVKNLSLMRWLVRLVTPPGGMVLDPFTGSGSTGCAAALEGFAFTGIELSEEYAEIARRRIAHWQGVADHTAAEVAERQEARETTRWITPPLIGAAD